MRSHTKLYLEFFDYTVDQTEYKPCEICSRPVVDVHHIDPRGMGGSKEKDYIENLMGLCRDCHDDCEDDTKIEFPFSEEAQKSIHLEFIKHYQKYGKAKIQNLRKG